MNCPICIKLNVYSEIVVLPGLYICKNEMCEFCETIENVEKLNENTNYEISESNVSNAEFLCSENDIFKDQVFQYENPNEINTFPANSNIDLLMLEFENTCNQLINSNLENTKSMYNETRNSMDFDIFNANNDSKREMVSKILSENVLVNLKHNKYKIFNWLRMSNSFNIESKIARILLLFLDFFQNDENRLINEIKHEYIGLEIFGNNLSRDKIKPLSYNLIEKLYYATHDDSSEEATELGYESLLKTVSCLFNKYDVSGKLKLNLSTTNSCSSCGYKVKQTSTDYFLKIGRLLNEIKENKLVSESVCLKCGSSKSRKRISLKRVPEFLIFYCPNGLENDIDMYENRISTLDNRKLCVVAVVELEYSTVQLKKDDLPTRKLFEVSSDRRCSSSNYCVHFRNKNGWYSLNDLAPVLVKPTQHLSTNNDRDVKLVILGIPPDTDLYFERFSLRQFIIGNQNYLSEEVLESCRSNKLRDYCNDVFHKLVLKENKNRRFGTRLRKKYNKYIERTIDIDDLECNSNLTSNSQLSHSKKNKEITLPTTQMCTYSSDKSFDTNASSSGVSSSSSLFDTELSRDNTQKTASLSTVGLNYPAGFINLHKQSLKRRISLDDLINKQYQRLKKPH